MLKVRSPRVRQQAAAPKDEMGPVPMSGNMGPIPQASDNPFPGPDEPRNEPEENQRPEQDIPSKKKGPRTDSDSKGEDTDDRHAIQSMTGRLAEKLREYARNNESDSDLFKYVAGMINSQVTQGMSADDADEVIEKLRDHYDFKEDEGDDDRADSGGEEQNEAIDDMPRFETKPHIKNLKKQMFSSPTFE